MDSIGIPSQAATCRAYCATKLVGPPAGVADAECASVRMLIEPPGLCDRAVGRANYAYFRPTEAELALLNAGGFLDLALYGGEVQPFGLSVWQAPAPAGGAAPAADCSPLPVEALAAALDAALEALWPGAEEVAASSRRVYRPVVAIAMAAAVPALTAAIADRLHPHRFDYTRGRARPPDTFYSGVIEAEALVRAVTVDQSAPLDEGPASSASID